MVNSPLYLNHPLVRQCQPLGQQVLPLSLYSDGISVTADPYEDTLYVIYLSFTHRLLNDNADLNRKHVFTVYRNSQASRETLQDIWQVLVWELHALVKGRLPLVSDFGKPFGEQHPGDYIGGAWGRTHKVCLMQVNADNAYYLELGVRPWNSLMHMCPWCRACRDGRLTWKDFTFVALWLSHCRGHAEFLQDMEASEQADFRQRTPFAFLSVITRTPFFSWDMVTLDWMHCADLGIIPYELGEILWSLLPHLSPRHVRFRLLIRKMGLQALKVRMARYYSASKSTSRIPIRRLTSRKLKAKHHPKLKAKAPQARALVPFVAQLAREHRSLDGQLGEDRFQCIWHLARICELATQTSLTERELLEWRRLAVHHMFYYVRCGFRLYPKHHFFMHFPAQVRRCGVPRSFWN